MFRIFLKNLFKGLILNALLLGVILLLFVAIAFITRILGIPMIHQLFMSSPVVYLIMSPVLSFAAGIGLFWLARWLHIPFVFEDLTVDGFGYWKNRCEKGKALRPWQCYLALGGHLFITFVTGGLAWLAYEKLGANLNAGIDAGFFTGYSIFFMVMGSVAAFQLVYYFATVYQYHYTICPSCKRMLCVVDEKTVASVRESETQYRDDSTAYGSTRDVHRTTSQIICRCMNCNSQLIHNDVVHSVDPWKEIK